MVGVENPAVDIVRTTIKHASDGLRIRATQDGLLMGFPHWNRVDRCQGPDTREQHVHPVKITDGRGNGGFLGKCLVSPVVKQVEWRRNRDVLGAELRSRFLYEWGRPIGSVGFQVVTHELRKQQVIAGANLKVVDDAEDGAAPRHADNLTLQDLMLNLFCGELNDVAFIVTGRIGIFNDVNVINRKLFFEFGF